MKAKAVDHITSNEDHVRMMIFDGDLQISDAADELLRIEKAQHQATRFWYEQRIADMKSSR